MASKPKVLDLKGPLPLGLLFSACVPTPTPSCAGSGGCEKAVQCLLVKKRFILIPTVLFCSPLSNFPSVLIEVTFEEVIWLLCAGWISC